MAEFIFIADVLFALKSYKFESMISVDYKRELKTKTLENMMRANEGLLDKFVME